MIKFIDNIGDFFATNYFDEDFVKTVHSKSGFSSEDQKGLQKRISPLKDKYFKYKQSIIEGRLRTKDKIYETHQFHTQLLNSLGYDGEHHQYDEPFHFSETEVLPVRHKLYRGDQLHLMILEMQSFIKEGDEEPDGLFEQRYNIEEDELQSKEQRYHRAQWSRVFSVDESLKVSPAIINKAISQLCLLEQKERPQYILLLAGNVVFLIDVEKWFRGSYLYFDLEEFFSEATITKNYYSLFYLMLSKDMLAPDSDMVLMNQLEEDSHKSAYEVTKDLKEGIIHAVEALANEAIYYQKEILNQEFDETDDDYEAQVKDDCLSIIYRLLFVFYAESRAELDILPISDSVYQKGYSLEMLRDLEQTPLQTVHARDGYFFHDSLHQLFQLMSSGYRENSNGSNKSFRIRHIDSPLFDDEKLNKLKGIKYRNFVWQDVICQLSLSKEVRGKNRGRISYANLGINQIGSVYESLLAFRGFYAEQDYIEVHPKNKPKEGTLLVPRNRRDDFDDGEVLKDEQDKDVIIPRGQFVYRLSGRDRQKSASYYTPEVLTQCTVKYTLKSILEKVENGEMKALELLDLKLLEPAMGAAAFHNELINQLAEAYLSYRQKEKKEKISPEKFQEELQKVKAYIATNNTYGVDLNPTAIELGKLSLWLNVIHKDMETPFFGYRLGVGNAVVGAWLKAYNKKDIIVEFPTSGTTAQRRKPIKKEWWDKSTKHLKFRKNDSLQREDDEIYHFLLPDKNMVPSASIKLLKGEFPDEAKRVTDWRKDFCTPINGDEIKRLQKLSKAVDVLLEEHYKFQASINAQTKLKGNFFGAYEEDEQGQLGLRSYDEKEKLASQRNNTNAPYYKLKLIMDYWCSLWFWDMREAAELPTRQQWYDDLEKIINIDLKQIKVVYEEVESDLTATPTLKQTSLFEVAEPQLTLKSYRKDKTETLKTIGKALQANPDSLFRNKRSEIVNKLADQYKFFHNQLEFIEVFKERGGFDVIAGNPPWVMVNIDLSSFLSDIDPICIVRNYDSAKNERLLKESILENNSIKNQYIKDLINVQSSKTFSGALVNFSLIAGQKPNLHKLVIENCINLSSGISGIIHDKGIYEDNNAQYFRSVMYNKLEYYFQFQNELKLFADVGNTKKFEVSIFNKSKDHINFYAISNLFHPSTIDQSFVSEANNNVILGIKNENNKWELRGNKSRLITIDDTTLRIYSELFEKNAIDKGGTLANIHSTELNSVLLKFNSQIKKLKNFQETIEATIMLDETKAKRDGIIVRNPTFLDASRFVLAGPHFYVGNPLFQTPNENCSSHRDYSFINLKSIDENYLPRTIYELLIEGGQINQDPNYFYVNRKRAQPSNERTLISCIQPPGRVHTIGSYSLHFEDELLMLSFSAYSFSIVYDFFVRISNREDILFDTISNLPIFVNPNAYILNRALLLNCVTNKYENLWNKYSYLLPLEDCFSSRILNLHLKPLSHKNSKWNFEIPLKDDYSRRQALIEIDVLVALEMGLTWIEFLTIYKIQFPVLESNESKSIFDRNGQKVTTAIKNEYLRDVESGSEKECYQYFFTPFLKCDRVEDYKTAWAHFEKIFKEN